MATTPTGAELDRGLTITQASRLMRLYRCQAVQRPAWALGSRSSSMGGGCSSSQAGHEQFAVPSHPISVPASGRTSETGAGSGVFSPRSELPSESSSSSIGSRRVQGIPELPPRQGNSAASAASRGECRRHSQASLRLLRELLRRDYAIGYLLLGWMLQTTWSVAPAIAMLLGLPQPDARTAKAQLPALLTWMLTGSSRSSRPSSAGHAAAAAAAAAEAERDEDEQMLLQLLSADELQQLQEQLVGPTAALASLANFMKAHQTLAGAPATAQQVNSTSY
ncbi:hypothetical protein OEZ86_004812 [Tetradesmus obliquus]|nr:hypothetical protein OEZ86_004812 [Tetradesmus obliquus]